MNSRKTYLPRAGHPLYELSVSQFDAREREIVQLLVEGRNSEELALVLGVSVKTGETHRANIMRKLAALQPNDRDS